MTLKWQVDIASNLFFYFLKAEMKISLWVQSTLQQFLPWAPVLIATRQL